MDKGTLHPFHTGGFIFFHSNDGFKIVSRGNRTREIGGLDHHALGGLEVEIVVHGIRNRIPRDRDAPITRLRSYVLRR